MLSLVQMQDIKTQQLMLGFEAQNSGVVVKTTTESVSPVRKIEKIGA